MTIKTLKQGKEILKKHYDQQLKIAEKSGVKADVAWVEIKYSHSLDVFNMSKVLIKNDKILSKLDNKYKLYGKLGALLHDIGRAYKIGENKNKIEPHGVYGAENILRNIENEDNPFILLSMKYHDILDGEKSTKQELKKYNLSRQEKDIIILLLNLVRDSDKLANFVLFKKINGKFFLTMDKKLYFSKACIKAFKNRVLIARNDRETIFDQILGYINWIYDLNFQASRDFVIQKKCIHFFLKKIDEIFKEIKCNYCKEEIQNFKLNLNDIIKQLKKDKYLF